MEVIGAGVGRTGTVSLKVALERLLGGPCYHSTELWRHPRHLEFWDRAIDGKPVRWENVFRGYKATVDWWGASFFYELAEAYPHAVVLLTVRDPDEWWRSVRATIVTRLEAEVDQSNPIEVALAPTRPLLLKLLRARFTPDWPDETAVKEAYLRHNEAVRSTIAPQRLIEWRVGDGWTALCDALGLPVPSEPFPHRNTTSDFLAGRI